MIQVIVNGHPKEISEGMTISTLLEELKLTARLVVVERNRDIINRADYSQVQLQQDDELEIVHFVGGGSSGILPQ